MFVWNVAPVMLLWCSDNTQSFVHGKSSFISEFISGKSRNPQKLLRYLSGIVTSTFKDGTGDCGGYTAWVSSGFCGGCGGRLGIYGVFPTIFVLYLNDLLSEALSSTSSISSLWQFHKLPNVIV